MKTYITLFDDTFLWFNKQQGVLYNVRHCKLFEFSITDAIYEYCLEFKDHSNLYTLSIPSVDFLSKKEKYWIARIANVFGRIHYTDSYLPMSFPPLLNVRSIVSHRLNNDDSYIRAMNLKENLSELTIFTGGEQTASKTRHYYKQVLYPMSSGHSIDVGKLCVFFDKNHLSCLRQLNIVGSNLQELHNTSLITNLANLFNIRIDYYMIASNTKVLFDNLNNINIDKFNVNLFFEDISIFKALEQSCQMHHSKFKWIFLVKNKSQYFKYSKLIEQYNIDKFEILPIVDNNGNFIKNNMRISKYGLLQQKILKREIFCNSVINSNYWGQLYILPDMSIWSNLYKSKIGTIDEDLINILKKECFDENSSWKETRCMIDACNGCNYSQLCPPPSKLEYAQNDFQICFNSHLYR